MFQILGTITFTTMKSFQTHGIDEHCSSWYKTAIKSEYKDVDLGMKEIMAIFVAYYTHTHV